MKHYIFERLKKLLPIFTAYSNREETVKHALPPMKNSVAEIIRHTRVIEIGLGHIAEGHFDGTELKEEFRTIAQFALSLPETLENDGSFWGYALGLVTLDTLKAGAEYREIEEIQNYIWALDEVLKLKQKIRDEH